MEETLSEQPQEDPVERRFGSNQVGVKQFNERLILDIIRQSGPMSKADISRITKLSAQTVTVIVNRLITDGFLLKNQSVKGRIGQPSTPISLDPDGAVSIGIKLGRRSLDAVTMSFTNQIIGKRSLFYEYPDCDRVFSWIRENTRSLIADLTPRQSERLAGVGVATPYMLEGWEGVVGAPKGAMAKWKGVDIGQRIESDLSMPVHILNDASAACLAEMSIGDTSKATSFLYFYIGTFVGGGIVTNGKLFTGLTGNAAALGSIPLHMITETGRVPPPQLIEAASIHRLEAMAEAAGLDRQTFYSDKPVTEAAMNIFRVWAIDASSSLAFAIIAGQSFLDTGLVIIDGNLSRDLLDILIDDIRAQMQRYDQQGIEAPQIKAGHLGNDARAKGGAILPLHANFAPDNNVLLKIR